MQDARLKWRSISVRPRKRCSAEVAPDFLRGAGLWAWDAAAASGSSPPQPHGVPGPVRAGKDVPGGVEVREAGAAAAGQCREELRRRQWGPLAQLPGCPQPPTSPGDFLSPTHNAPHRIQGCLSACEIQDRQNIWAAQETVEALEEREGRNQPDTPLSVVPTQSCSLGSHSPHCPLRPLVPRGSQKGPGGSGQSRRQSWKPARGPEPSFLGIQCLSI